MSASLPAPLHPVHNPRTAPLPHLEQATAGHAALIARVRSRIETASRSGTRAHTLLRGPWGSGKTHILAVATGQALRSEKVAARVALAWLSDDALPISSYPDLLHEAITTLGPEHADEARAARLAASVSDLEDLLATIVGRRLLVLVAEHIDVLFDRIGGAGARALRGFVETHGRTLVLASASRLVPALSSRAEPWYGNLDIDTIPPLGTAEAVSLLRHRATSAGDEQLATWLGTAGAAAAIETVHRAIGGSPRAWQIIADTARPSTLGQPAATISKLLDTCSPHYQHELLGLANTERQLLLGLARAPGPITVGELADNAGLTANTAAVTLRRLADNAWVRGGKLPGEDQRRTYYQFTDPMLAAYLLWRDTAGTT
ncbi:helix-turn-helix domain-containing protein [Lolliginicoccus suaedae]|uniref:MarR family transcriptional regulator n=1 Tax=Lolliginicoccus suaedae TaxID=2605429 RepID=UPI0011EFC27F|nr:MarR family transcriptional regulator [Lolliginicoccus suaedae]